MTLHAHSRTTRNRALAQPGDKGIRISASASGGMVTSRDALNSDNSMRYLVHEL